MSANNITTHDVVIDGDGYEGVVCETEIGVPGMVNVRFRGGRAVRSICELKLVRRHDSSNFAAECAAWTMRNRGLRSEQWT